MTRLQQDAQFKAVARRRQSGRRLHEAGIILTVFGRPVPGMVHDLEYPDLVLQLTRQASPSEVVGDFWPPPITGGRGVPVTERHANCTAEYDAVTDRHENVDYLNYFDGPDIGTVVCRQCGRLFLFRRVESTGTGQVGLHFPATEQAEADWKAERIDPHAVRML